MIDAVVVGAGFAGAVFARELADAGRRVLVIEKRSHIGGNCHDARDRHGIIVHRYGPHLFHTDNADVYRYLGRYTRWQEYEHRVLAHVEGHRVPLPFNLDSLRLLFPRARADMLETRLVDRFGFGSRVPILTLLQTDDAELAELGRYVFDRVFVNYTAKQWGCRPEDVGEEVMGRVPVAVSRDGRYFQDRYQAVPEDGYTALFANLLDHERIHLLLNTDFADILALNPEDGTMTLFGRTFRGQLIYTGMIDALFGFSLGRLPYRALRFSFQSLNREFYQEASVENYPNTHDFTRITEFKRIHGQSGPWTTILREYPEQYDPDSVSPAVPCYPMFDAESRELYRKYAGLAGRLPALVLVGRLAEYRYYDMDDIVARVLDVARRRIQG